MAEDSPREEERGKERQRSYLPRLRKRRADSKISSLQRCRQSCRPPMKTRVGSGPADLAQANLLLHEGVAGSTPAFLRGGERVRSSPRVTQGSGRLSVE